MFLSKIEISSCFLIGVLLTSLHRSYSFTIICLSSYKLDQFNSISRTRRHMWVEFVVGSRPRSEGFSPGSPVFLPPQKSTLLNSNSIGNNGRRATLICGSATANSHLFIFIYLFYYPDDDRPDNLFDLGGICPHLTWKRRQYLQKLL